VWFLSAREQELQNERMKENEGGVDHIERTEFRLIKQALLNPLYICVGFIYFCCAFSVQSLAIFLPTILNALGYTVLKSELYSAWPNVLATGMSLLFVYGSHFTKRRAVWIMPGFAVAAIGFGMLLSKNNNIAYVGIYIASLGAFNGGPLLVGWNAMNAEPITTRGVAMAMGPSIGHLGAIAASWAYRTQDAPKYKLGNGLNLCMSVCGVGFTLLAMFIIRRENNARAAGKRNYRLSGIEAEDEKLGSLHPNFRYIM